MKNVKIALSKIEMYITQLEGRIFDTAPYHMILYYQVEGMLMNMLLLDLIDEDDYIEMHNRLENCKISN